MGESPASSAQSGTPAVRRTRGPYRVNLTESASIVARGEQLLLWLVELDGRWVRSGDHPAAALESEASSERHGSEHCPSGTIWQRHVELSLAAGTRLRRRRSWPRVRQLSVMGYLNGGVSRAQRLVEEREFVLVGNYRLLPVGSMRTKTAPPAKRSTERPSSRPDREESDPL